MTISVLIVDDEFAARQRIKKLVKVQPNFELLGEAGDGPTAVEKIEALCPDLVFLDVQMPAMNGFEVLRQLSDEDMPAVVFVTAFEVSAIDYLLKPVSAERFQQGIKRIDKLMDSSPNALQNLLDMENQGYVKQLPVRFLKRVKLLNVDDISHIISEHRLVNVYSRSGERFWTNETLDRLQDRLDPSQFCRTHRSSILNLSAEFELEYWEDGRLKVHFPSGDFLTVARDPAKEIRSRLDF